jgi:hypothetical protein
MRALAAVLAIGAVVAAQQPEPEPARDNPFRPFDRAAFSAHCQKLGATPEQLAPLNAAEVTQLAPAADGLLRKLVPDYEQAAAKADAGDPAAALALARLLQGTQDRYLAAHLRYRLGRAFLDGDDPERAAQILDEYLTKDRNLTALDGEALFFFAQALAGIPDRERAAKAFAGFLRWFKDSAPERFLASAQQQLAELGAAQDSPLHDIADVMKNCERRIKKTDTGKETQDKQEAVLTKLQELIEQLEEQEKQSSGGPGGLGRPTTPAGKSALPGEGATQVGSLNKAPSVVERWGNMKDRDREAIETDLQKSLPGPYQKMLEEYYKKLNAGKQ